MQVFFIVGTTASGKSALALHWAQKLGGAIVNCDSIQVYQGLDIGSAKPSAQERSLVPHYLFDFVPVGEELTAGQYQRIFFETMKDLENKYPVVFVVGGTGFYFQAIEKGMYPIGAAKPELIAEIEQELKTSQGAYRLYQELVQKDPIAASKISEQDHYRIARAIEMMRTHGKTVTEIKRDFEDQRKPFPYPLKKIGVKLSREQLLLRVQERTQKMLAEGLLSEVEGLLLEIQRLDKLHWAPMRSVGYLECVEFLRQAGNGIVPRDAKGLEDSIVQSTMQLAKKQRTWFQRDKEIYWHDASADTNDINKLFET